VGALGSRKLGSRNFAELELIGRDRAFTAIIIEDETPKTFEILHK